MREFAKGQFRLHEAPRALRMIYAGFLLLTLIGLVSQLGFQAGRIGFRPAAIARYYRGDDTGLVLAFPKTFGQLLEVTHAHAFVMAVFFLILAHLFAGTGVPPVFRSSFSPWPSAESSEIWSVHGWSATSPPGSRGSCSPRGSPRAGGSRRWWRSADGSASLPETAPDR